jgi:hypothetical protein
VAIQKYHRAWHTQSRIEEEMMAVLQRVSKCILLSTVIFMQHPVHMPAQTSSGGMPQASASASERDGQHDFDFEFGSWKVHNRRLLHPLAGSNDWVEFDGTVVARPVWGGRANMDEFEADSPSGRIEGMTVRTYNTKSHQWSLYWANQKNGVFSLPATVGKFKDGRGEFYDQEDFNGTNIFVRYLWTLPSPDSPHWEQAFSVDGGKTWETNWVTDFTRVKQ